MGVNVIDVGCADHGEPSIPALIEEFQPPILIGLDPHPNVSTGAEQIGGSYVITFNAAAWVRDGRVGFTDRGEGSWTLENSPEAEVPCLDLAKLVRVFAPVVLKIDAEGAEYPLLSHLWSQGALGCLTLAWIEWHEVPGHLNADREAMIASLPCEYREWLP